MQDLYSIKVECYSGYKADEYPVRFYWNEKRYDIKEILDRWYQGDQNPESPVSNYFKVFTTCENEYILKHEIKSDDWFLIVRE